MRKTLIRVTVAALALSGLAGCGSSSSAKPTAAKEFSEAMHHAAQGTEPYHFTMEMKVGTKIAMKGEGDFGPGPAFRLTLSAPEKMKMIAIGDSAYVRSTKSGWIDATDALASEEGALYPGPFFELFRTEGHVTFRGEETFAGERVKHYTLVLDPQVVKGTGVIDSASLNLLRGDLVYDLWIDANQNPVKLSNTVDMGPGRFDTVMLMSDYGMPVRIKAPPAAQVRSID